MSCEIQYKNDFLTGSFLITEIPENELDQNALHTIQADYPDFILPFSYKSMDGKVEFVYKVGTLSKLQYFSGELNIKEYVALWQSLLEPLLECGDWFMNPCSFVLNTDYIYYDKNKKVARYVYIPSTCGCSGYDAFHDMAVELSKMMTVSDSTLENKVLRTIIKGFSPIEFLNMLKEYLSECASSPEIESDYAQLQEELNEPDIDELSPPTQDSGEDISIDINPDVKDVKTELNKKDRESGGYKMFSGRSKRKKVPQRNIVEKTPPQQESSVPKQKATTILLEKSESQVDLYPIHKNLTEPIVKKYVEIIDITQSTSIMLGGTGLRYVGRASLPPTIKIPIAEGEMFTIGRFDSTIGKKQSCFEFDKKTKAVSRRHAVIERDANGYKIVDLSSSAGTFVNDRKLPPNTPYSLETGCRISFGNSGADYVWEVS